MSQIEVLPSVPISFNFEVSRSAPAYNQSNRECHRLTSLPSRHAQDNDSLHTSYHITTAHVEPRTTAESIFPSLPPLHTGHPQVHLRNGIMNSSRLSAEGEPDAEKAFFVCDLVQVYRQQLRWKACLPEIQPFYGKHPL